MTQGQPHHHSLLESVVNIVIGFGIALIVQIIVFPYYGLEPDIREHLEIGYIFTVVSLCRSYLLRRVFNGITVRRK